MTRRRFTGVLLTLTGGLGAGLYGCGGGDKESIPQGNDAMRAVSLGAYQAFSSGSAYPLAAIRLAAPTGSQFSTTRAAALSRAVPTALVFDSVLQAYKRYKATGNTVDVTYYSDSGGTNAVGTAAVAQPGGGTFTNDYAAYPARVEFTANTNTSVLPFTGYGSVVFADATGANTLTGRFTSRQNSTTLEGTLTLSAAGAITGSMTLTQGGVTVRFTNITGPLTGELSSDVACEPYGWTGRATFNLSTSAFSLTLTTNSGPASATRDASNNLVLQFADGTTQTVETPLKALLNGLSSGGGSTPTPTPSPSPTPTPTPLPTTGDYALTLIGPTGGQLRFAGRNESGQSVASEGTTTAATGYLFSAAGVKTQLPTLDGYTGNIPAGINNAGKVVGTCYRATSPAEAAYIYDIATGNIAAIPEMRIARGINNNGKVVGVNLATSFMLYDTATSTASAPALNQFSPYGISDTDVVVGAITGSALQGAYYDIASNTLKTIPLESGQTNNPAYVIAPSGSIGGVSWSSTSDETGYIFSPATSVTTLAPVGQGNLYVAGELPGLALGSDGRLATLDNQTGYFYYNGVNHTMAEAIGTTSAATWNVKQPIGFASDNTLLAQAFRQTDSTWQLVKLTRR